MKKAIRIIDIAEALGMSRNTVAKALNGQRVPDHTRKLVFEKAVALGYEGMGSLAAETGYLKKQRILIITSHPLSDLSFFMSLIRWIETTVRAHNFELVQYTFNENSTYRELTNYIRMLHLDGIICIEAFDEHFVKHILQLNIPVVFIDFLVPSKKIIGSYDIVLMNNVAPIKDLCRQLIDRNYYKTFGFVGDYRHCLGFYERFVAMREALFEASLPYEPQYSLTMSDDYPYGDVSKMKEKLREMHKLPQVFVCANDSIASPSFKP
jgi:LacI family transcriptional regulator